MMTLLIGLGVLCPLGAWLAVQVGAPWFTGALVGLSGIATYLVYERVHFRAHFRPARTRYARWQQRRHLHHHARAGTANYGVTSPVWDVVFGTYEPVAADEPLPARTTAF
jgi:sterol desaturase/sphingolipid hydroxylase (fatty acid hydroxylase superfamily)